MVTPDYDESERQIVWDVPEWTASIHTARLAEGIEMTFFHLDVYYHSPSILRDMLAAWKQYRQRFLSASLRWAMPTTDALDRLRERFGFRYFNDIPCTDGHPQALRAFRPHPGGLTRTIKGTLWVVEVTKEHGKDRTVGRSAAVSSECL
jgi:hypothetical protein